MTITDPLHWVEQGKFKGDKYDKIVEMITEINNIIATLPTHASTHEDEGTDEISVAGLSGLLADDQTPLSHDNTKHSTNYEVANANIQAHVASPAADAHHTKYALLDDLIANEITAIKAIDDASINNTKWDYIAALTESPQTHMSAANPHSGSASDTDLSNHMNDTSTHGVSQVADNSDLHSETHVLATSGPHTGTLPLTDLVVGISGSIIIRGAADWEELAKANDTDVLTLVSGLPAWAAQGAPGAHDIITTHTDTGLTIGHVIRASGATTFVWAQLGHGDLSGIGTNAHIDWTSSSNNFSTTGTIKNPANDSGLYTGASDDIRIYRGGTASWIESSTQPMIVYSSASYAMLRSHTGQHQYFDCGNLFYWRDRSNVVRMILSSANGTLRVGAQTLDAHAYGPMLERVATVGGEVSSRLLLNETLVNAKEYYYGVSLNYQGDAANQTLPSGAVLSWGNGMWGIKGHSNLLNGVDIMYGDRAGTYINFGTTNIAASTANITTLTTNIIKSANDPDHRIVMDGFTDMIYIYPGDVSTDAYWILWSPDNAVTSPILYTVGIGKGRVGTTSRYIHSVSAYTLYYHTLSATLDEHDDLALIDAIDAERDDKGDLIRDEWNNPIIDLNTVPTFLFPKEEYDKYELGESDIPQIMNAGNTMSLLMGGVKQLHQKVKDQELLIEQLAQKIEILKGE